MFRPKPFQGEDQALKGADVGGLRFQRRLPRQVVPVQNITVYPELVPRAQSGLRDTRGLTSRRAEV